MSNPRSVTRLAAKYPAGSPKRLALLAGIKVGGVPRILFTLIEDLAAECGATLSPRDVKELAQDFIKAVEYVVESSDFWEDGPGSAEGWKGSGNTSQEVVAEGKQVAGGWESPPEYEEVFGEVEYQPTWKAQDPLEIEDIALYESFCDQTDATGAFVDRNRQVFLRWLKDYRKVLFPFVQAAVKHALKTNTITVDPEDLEEYVGDTASYSIPVENADYKVEVTGVSSKLLEGRGVSRGYTFLIETTVGVELDMHSAEIDYSGFDYPGPPDDYPRHRWASLHRQALRIAADLPAGDPTRRKILAVLGGK